MTVDRETREAVAKAIFCTARPGHRWYHQPPEVLEYWGVLADAALAAGCQTSVPESGHDHVEVIPKVASLVKSHREQRLGAVTTGCSCGWCPVAYTETQTISLLTQYAEHVAGLVRALVAEVLG